MTNRVTGLQSGLDTESLITALTQTYQTRVDKQKSGQTRLSWTQDLWKTTNKSIVSFYNGNLSSMRFTDAYTKKTTSSTNADAVSVVTGDSAMIATQKAKVNKLATTSYLTGESLGSSVTGDTTLSSLGITSSSTLKFGIGEAATDGTYSDYLSVNVDPSATLSELVSSLTTATSSTNSIGLTASFDATNHRLYMASENTGVANGFTLLGSGTNDANVLAALGLDGATTVAAQDASLTLNGVEYTSASNTMTVNGLTLTLKATTDDEFTLNTTQDNSGIYSTIKDFLSGYNTLIKSLDTLYNADKASKYDILTDDEKDSMTDDEITEWNKTIKSGLLSGNDTLQSVISALKNGMSSSFDGVSLSTFGINTLGYFDAEENERGQYHIDGNKDDDYTSSKTDLLSAAIAADPDSVSDFFTQLTRSVYSSLGNLMKSSTYSSAYTVYEDKLMASQYSDYTDSISDAEDELEERQNYYYSKFAAMETALTKLNSNSSSLTSMLS